MGQEISAIITNQKLDMDEEIVHFKEGNCNIIPLDIHPEHIIRFVTEAAAFDRVEEVLIHLEANNDPYRKNDDRSNPGEEDYLHSLDTVIEWIRSLNLRDFIVQYHSDFAGIPTDAAFILITEGKIVPESAMADAQGIDWDAYEVFAQKISLNPRWFNDEAKYQWYSNAEEMYRSQNPTE